MWLKNGFYLLTENNFGSLNTDIVIFVIEFFCLFRNFSNKDFGKTIPDCPGLLESSVLLYDNWNVFINFIMLSLSIWTKPFIICKGEIKNMHWLNGE
jgi:hypothetical protein